MPTRRPNTNTRLKNTTCGSDELFAGLKATENGKSRALNKAERNELAAMLSHKENPEALALDPLVPRGSYIARILRFFEDSDVSYAVPLFQLVSLAASYLTQRGACLNMPGLGLKRPVLWIIALASSGASKTLATDTVESILRSSTSHHGIRMLPAAASDAQWIIDLSEDNGAYWLQDEVGQFFHHVFHSSRFERIKPWMLDAYSNKQISNRLKGEKIKLVVDDPHFTFLGLTVRETWNENVNAASMLDGFCQRFNYVIAPPRLDTDMFDHFLYFSGDHIDAWKAELGDIWAALCNQPGATETYELDGDVRPFLESWWQGLRHTWGDGAVPGSFLRRIGYSVWSYLVVIHFLLGRSRRPIDIETAKIATAYAEFHMESALIMVREYGGSETQDVQWVTEARASLRGRGLARVTSRDVQRTLSAKKRKSLSTEKTKRILEALDRVEVKADDAEDMLMTRHEKAEMLSAQHRDFKAADRTREGWRNEKRLQAVRAHYAKLKESDARSTVGWARSGCDDDGDMSVVDLTEAKKMRAT